MVEKTASEKKAESIKQWQSEVKGVPTPTEKVKKAKAEEPK